MFDKKELVKSEPDPVSGKGSWVDKKQEDLSILITKSINEG